VHKTEVKLKVTIKNCKSNLYIGNKLKEKATVLCVVFIYYTHTHPFIGPLCGTTRVSQYEKGKTNLDFTETRDSEWQWHQLGHMQVYTSLQADNHASTPPLSFYRPDALPAAQPTVSKHIYIKLLIIHCKPISVVY